MYVDYMVDSPVMQRFGPQASQHLGTFRTVIVLPGHGTLESSEWLDCACGGESSSSTSWTCPMQDLTKHLLDLPQAINGGAISSRMILSMLTTQRILMICQAQTAPTGLLQ